MKASSLATPLTRFSLISALLGVGTAFLSAQPAGIPPAGSGMMNMPPGAVQPPMYQQPAPYAPPPSYPQQQAYIPPTYTPQGSTRAPAPALRPRTTSVPAKKPVAPTYRPPSLKAPTTSKPKTTSLETKVARLESNDRRQDMRLGNLERDVGLLPDTIEGGGIADLSPTGKTYVMRPGDTLWSVASKHGTSINSLRSANHLSDDNVGVGETLLIPTGEINFDSPAPSSRRQHIVKSGETFTKIASNYGISVHALAKANPSAYADKLLIGERLTIPGGKGGSSGGSTRTVVTTSSTHTVKKGEHLGSIAKKYGISTASLAAANRLKNANIVVIGQRLSIPGVKTTRSVPQNLAVADPETVPLHDMRLTDTAPLVKPEPPTPPSMPLPPITPSIVPTTPQTPRGVVAYRMERGDTLETVANMFSTTPENIRALNKLPANKQVKEGEEIVVPSIGAVSVN